MELSKMAEKFGMKITHDAAFKFMTGIFPYVRAHKESSSSEYEITSEFILVRVSQQTIESPNGLFQFKDFQDQLMAPIFFRYSSDLRWNLYLILIVDQSIKAVLDIPAIENDDSYARKFVLTEQEALDYFTRRWMRHSSIETDHARVHSPVEGWIQQLELHGLVGCLSNAYSSRQVEDFIDGSDIVPTDDFIDDEPTSQGRGRQPSTIDRIHRIHLGNFRSHCFGNHTVSPGQINLIYGANGSGKTSLLEAIEYCLTNEIRRNKDFRISGHEPQENLFVEYESNGEMISLQPGGNSNDYKSLEEHWYGVPIGRNKTTINENFHRFNFFDTEAAYKFALQDSDRKNSPQFDYEETLSRLIFGEQIVAMQKRWKRFEEAFSEKSAELKRDISRAEAEVRSIEQEMTIISNESVPTEFLEELRDILLALGYYHTPDSFDSAQLKLGPFASKITSYEQHVNLMINASETMHPFTVSHIIEQSAALERDFEETSHSLGEVNHIVKSSKEQVDALISRKNMLTKSRQKLKKKSERLSSSTRFKSVLSAKDLVDERLRLDDEMSRISHQITIVKKVVEQWPSVGSMTLEDFNTVSNKEIEDYKSALTDNLEAKVNIDKELKEVESKIGRLQALQGNIRQLASEYMMKIASQTVCPLCGHDHGSAQALVDAIHQEISFLEPTHEYQTLEHKKSILEQEIEGIQRKLHEYQIRRLNVQQLRDASRQLFDAGFTNRDYEESVESTFRFVQASIAELSNFVSIQESIGRKISYLESEGFSLQNISEAEYFAETDPTFRRIMQQGMSSDDVYSRVKNICSAIDIGIRAVDQEIEKCNEEISNLRDLAAGKDTYNLESRKLYLQERLSMLRKLIGVITILRVDFEMPMGLNLTEWCITFRTLMSRVQALLHILEQSTTAGSLRKQLEKKTEELRTFQYSLSRCNVAENAFRGLRPLKMFVEEFIAENIVNIEHFFKLLHTPREFEHLRLSDSSLVATRRNQKDLVRPSQMSAGQRAAFALAVLFTPHLASDRVPKILLMDEPVANMDDLHLLNLFDVLRDIALLGHQVFLTTANLDVANLFRRKFSFFGKEFKQLTFLRSDDAQAQIIENTYTPDHELPIETNII